VGRARTLQSSVADGNAGAAMTSAGRIANNILNNRVLAF
jgi:hypothetical protein